MENVEKLAEEYIKNGKDFDVEGFSEYQNGKLNGFIDGYNAVLLNKQFSLKNILEKFHNMNMAYLTGKEDDCLSIDEFIQSLFV
jgi:hypothetical protein